AWHLLHRAARAESALGLLAGVPLVGERAAEPRTRLRTAILGLADHQRAPAEVLAVQLGDGLLRLLRALQVHEGESARSAGVLVGDDLDGGHLAPAALDGLADLLLGRVERQVAH